MKIIQNQLKDLLDIFKQSHKAAKVQLSLREYITFSFNDYFNSCKENNVIHSNINKLIHTVKNTDSSVLLNEMNWNDSNLSSKDYECFYNTNDELGNIGAFYLNNNNYSVLPIHDHKGMFVISKCLKGNLDIYNFNMKSKNVAVLDSIKKLETNEISLLYPHKNNIHHVELSDKNKPSVLLDIFIPHYIENVKEYKCNYYLIEENLGNNEYIMKQLI